MWVLLHYKEKVQKQNILYLPGLLMRKERMNMFYSFFSGAVISTEKEMACHWFSLYPTAYLS